MTPTDPSRGHGTGGRSTWLAAAALLVVVAAVIAWLLLRGGGDPGVTSAAPTRTTLHAPVARSGRCMVPSAQALSRASLAFDGTVLATDGARVTFAVTHWYTGQDFDRVQVDQEPQRLGELVGGADFRAGGRFLVAGTSGHELMVCGFSAPYSPELAGLYAEAFGS